MRKVFKRVVSIILAVIMLLSLSVPGSAAAKPAKVYKAGKIYAVGIDIPEGEYYAKAKKTEGEVRVLDENYDDGTNWSMKASFSVSLIFRAEEGQYISFNDCDVYLLDKMPQPKKDKTGAYPAGMYKGGMSWFPAGRYVITPVSGKTAYAELWSDCTYYDDDLINSGYVYSPTTISVARSVYLYVEDGTVKPVTPMLKDFGMSRETFLDQFAKYDSNWSRLPLKTEAITVTASAYSVYDDLTINVFHSDNGGKVQGAGVYTRFVNYSDNLTVALDNIEHYAWVLARVLLPKMSRSEYELLLKTLEKEMLRNREAIDGVYWGFAFREKHSSYIIFDVQQPVNGGTSYLTFCIVTPAVLGEPW